MAPSEQPSARRALSRRPRRAYRIGREPDAGSPEPLNWNERGYLKKDVPQDPWGNEFVYRNPGLVNPTGYDIVSPGLDGRLDTEDDIGNWNEID